MLVQVAENLFLILGFLFITLYLFRKPLHQLTIIQKISIGFIHGVFGIVSIYLSIEVGTNIILDFRQLALMLSVFYGGLPAVVLTSLIIGAYRLIFVNGVNPVAIIGTISIFLHGAGLAVISKYIHHYALKWSAFIFYTLVIGNITFLLVLEKSVLSILFYFSISIAIGGIIAAFTDRVFRWIKIKIKLNSASNVLIESIGHQESDSIYQKALEEIVLLLDCEYGSIITANGNEYKIICTLENGQFLQTNHLIHAGEVHAVDALMQGKPIIFDNWNKKRPSGELENRFFLEGVRSSMHIPILYNSEVIASINIASKGVCHLNCRQLDSINQVLPFLRFGFTLLESERKFMTVSQSASDAIILTDQHMKITSWNQGAEHIFGFKSSDVIGKNVDIIIPDAYKEAHSQGVMKFFKGEGSNIFGKTLELQGVRKDGSVFPIDLSINKWETGGMYFFSSIIRDISDRKRAEVELKESEERYRKLIELSPEGVCVYKDGTVVYANDKALELIEAGQASDLIGKPSLHFLAPEYLYELNELITGLFNNNQSFTNHEIALIKTTGERFFAEVSASKVSYYGDQAIMTTFRDITERKKTERQLKEANKLLKQLSSLDGLTGIANRRTFEEVLSDLWEESHLRSTPLSIIFCDIDNFKDYNDTYGHLEGDDCLKKVAQAITKASQGDRNLAARYGGEEFAVILNDTNERNALMIAERIRKEVISLQIEHTASSTGQYVSLSLGVSTLIPDDSYTEKELVQYADRALYHSKREGKNQVSLYKDKMFS